MKIALKIAIRFLTYNKIQSILIALGIAVGVSVQIFIGLLIQGLQVSLIDKTVGSSPQITVKSKTDDKLIVNWSELTEKIKNLKSEIKYISAVAESPAFIKNKGKEEPVLLRGFNTNDLDKIYKIKENLYKGNLPQNNNEIIIGKDLAEKIDVKLNDSTDIIDSKGNKSSIKIVGFYDLKVAQINNSWLITNIQTVQNIFDFDNKISLIEMQVDDVFQANTLASKVKKLTDSDLEVTNWIDSNEQLLSGLKGQDTSSYMIQVFVLIAVMLGISSVLAVTVVQKSKQIGILKAMGIKDRTASFIFIYQGMLMGVIGAILGIGLGLGLLYMFQTFAKNPDGTPVVPIYFNWMFIILSGVIAIIVAVLAALIPAKKSSKLSPIEVIRNG